MGAIGSMIQGIGGKGGGQAGGMGGIGGKGGGKGGGMGIIGQILSTVMQKLGGKKGGKGGGGDQGPMGMLSGIIDGGKGI